MGASWRGTGSRARKKDPWQLNKKELQGDALELWFLTLELQIISCFGEYFCSTIVQISSQQKHSENHQSDEESLENRIAKLV